MVAYDLEIIEAKILPGNKQLRRHQCSTVKQIGSYAFAAVDALHFEDLDLLLQQVGQVDRVHQQVLQLLLPLGLLAVLVLQLLQLVDGPRLPHPAHSPVLVLLRRLFEVLVDRVELLQRDFPFELVEVEDADLDDAFCALVGSVGDIALPFFVDGVQLTHLQQHAVFLIDLVLLDVLAEFLLLHHAFLLVFAQVFG